MKKINLKPLLMEKGERIGLFVAAGLSFLLVVIGVLKGFSAGSATANAKKLTDQLTTLENKQKSATPVATNPQHSPQDRYQGSLDELKFRVVASADYPSSGIFTAPRMQDNKRQRPTILQTDEYAVELVRVPLPGLSFDFEQRGDRKVPTHVYMIPAKAGAGMAGAGGPRAGGRPPRGGPAAG